MGKQKYIPIRDSQINYYKEFPLFYRIGEDRFALYKQPGVALKVLRLADEKHPDLYIDHENRIKAIKVLQKEFNKGAFQKNRATKCKYVNIVNINNGLKNI